MDEYLAINRANWDERARAHAASPDYAVDRFIEDPTFMSAVVRFDLPRLGDIAGLACVHLQCHIGTDTVSLSRLGARLTGLDLSPSSLREARRLAEHADAAVEFVEADVYSALDVLEPESSTWSTPASARCAGFPTSPAGHKRSPGCCAPAVASSSGRCIPCCPASTSRIPT